MRKTTTVSTTPISTIDTVITLPLSKKTIAVKKGYPADKIALLDDYLSKHNISNKPATIVPYAGYYQHTESYWELENQYEPANGRTLGIWQNNWIADTTLYNLGFREIDIYDANDRDAAYNAGFAYQNMMFMNVKNDVEYNESRYDDVNTSSTPITRCYIDEPYDSENKNGDNPQWSVDNVLSYVAFLQNHSANLFMSSFKESSFWNMSQTLNSSSNTYVMCDQYQTNVTSDLTYWKESFGSRNISDWMSLYTNYSNSGYPDFSTMFGAINNLGITDVWLYADEGANLDHLQQFSYAAWANAWLSRLEKHLVIVYQCSGLGCSWPDGGT